MSISKSFLSFLLLAICLSWYPDRAFSDDAFTLWINPFSHHRIQSKSLQSTKKPLSGMPVEECSSYDKLKFILENKLENRTSRFAIHLEYDFLFSEARDILNQAIEDIKEKDAYIYWNIDYYSYRWSGYDGNITIYYEFSYKTTYDQELYVSERINEIISDIITDEMNDEQKAKAIHDWIVLNVQYDLRYEEYSAYAALYLGTTVCLGYSLLAYKMLWQVGIESIIIVGDETMNHAWNMLKICDNWYHMDLTWDDPVPDVPGRVLYNYYNNSDPEIGSDHSWVAGIYPLAPEPYYEGICSEWMQEKMYFPHVASGGEWETEIAIINTSECQAINGALKPFNGEGEEVSENMEICIQPGARRQITVGSEFSDADQIRYFVFESDLSSLAGYTKFYTEGRYRVAVPATNDINTENIHISHIASDTSWWTGISLINTTEDTKYLVVEFDNGASKFLTLAGHAHTAFTIKSLFNENPQPDVHSAVIENGDGVIGLELFSSNNQLSGILLKSSTSYSIYYPHIASDACWFTGLVAYNSSSSVCDITITPYSAEGFPLTPQYFSINGHEKYIGTAFDLDLPFNTAWLQIEGSRPITGFELFGTHNGNQLAGYAGVGISKKIGVFAKLEQAGWTGITLVNIEDNPATVNLVGYDDNGNVVARETLIVNGHAKVVDMPVNIFHENISNATYIKYSSNRYVVGFQLNGSADNMMLDGLPGM